MYNIPLQGVLPPAIFFVGFTECRILHLWLFTKFCKFVLKYLDMVTGVCYIIHE